MKVCQVTYVQSLYKVSTLVIVATEIRIFLKLKNYPVKGSQPG